jgi:hypothetical protein
MIYQTSQSLIFIPLNSNINNMNKTFVLLFWVITNMAFGLNADTVTITVVASGETHAMLYPCDCQVNPGGGLAERAAAIKKFADTAKLLLDAGGFAGGGIYDDYTGGRAADSQRTLSTIRAMGMMKYDAVAVGDDDLQYGGAWLAAAAQKAGVPLVSANCFFKGRKPLVAPYRVVVKGGIRFAITALTTTERLFPIDDSCTILPPVASVRKLWKEMAAASDCRIILSHLGEEVTMMIADSFPDCDIIVNGHRKIAQSPASLKGRTLVMQFGYQGKKLSYAAVQFTKKHRVAGYATSGWIEVGPSSGADSAVKAALAGNVPAETKGVYDLYIMGQCPYGCAALREFVDFVKRFPGIEWNVWFIGSASGDSLSSLHGSDEANDEMSWLAVKSIYPDKWLSFLGARSAEGATTRSAAASLRLDTARIVAWVKKNGRQALVDHYRRSMRLAVTASPTLFINNVLFEKNIESRRLAKTQCSLPGAITARRPFCDSLPECFDNGDCRKRGMVGECLPPGKCEYKPDTAFVFTALIADSTIQHPEQSVIATTEELFPNATVQTVAMNSEKGLSMMQVFAPLSLPYYLFGSGVAKAYNYPRVESGLVKVKNGFTFKDGITPKNYFPRRERTPQSAVLFVDPLFSDAGRVIKTLLDDSLVGQRVRVLPLILSDPAAAPVTFEEKIRGEEGLRWLVIDSLYRRNFPAYLSGFTKDPGSSYWFTSLRAAGIDQETFVRQVKDMASLAADHWRMLGVLGIKGPLTLLLENRQVVVLQSETDVRSVLTAVEKRQGK